MADISKYSGYTCIVGAGPTGLLAAILEADNVRWAKMKGNDLGKIVVLEKRTTYTRDQIIYLSPNTIAYLPEKVRERIVGKKGKGCYTLNPSNYTSANCITDVSDIVLKKYLGASIPISTFENVLFDYIQKDYADEVEIIIHKVEINDFPILEKNFDNILGCDGKNSIVKKYLEIETFSEPAGFTIFATFKPTSKTKLKNIKATSKDGINLIKTTYPQQRFRGFTSRTNKYTLAVQIFEEDFNKMDGEYQLKLSDAHKDLQKLIKKAAYFYDMKLPSFQNIILTGIKSDLYYIDIRNHYRWKYNEETEDTTYYKLLGDSVMGTIYFGGFNFNNDVRQLQIHESTYGIGPFVFFHEETLLESMLDRIKRQTKYEIVLNKEKIESCQTLDYGELKKVSKKFGYRISKDSDSYDICTLVSNNTTDQLPDGTYISGLRGVL